MTKEFLLLQLDLGHKIGGNQLSSSYFPNHFLRTYILSGLACSVKFNGF